MKNKTRTNEYIKTSDNGKILVPLDVLGSIGIYNKEIKVKTVKNNEPYQIALSLDHNTTGYITLSRDNGEETITLDNTDKLINDILFTVYQNAQEKGVEAEITLQSLLEKMYPNSKTFPKSIVDDVRYRLDILNSIKIDLDFRELAKKKLQELEKTQNNKPFIIGRLKRRALEIQSKIEVYRNRDVEVLVLKDVPLLCALSNKMNKYTTVNSNTITDCKRLSNDMLAIKYYIVKHLMAKNIKNKKIFTIDTIVERCNLKKDVNKRYLEKIKECFDTIAKHKVYFRKYFLLNEKGEEVTDIKKAAKIKVR